MITFKGIQGIDLDELEPKVTNRGWAIIDSHTGVLLREGGCVDFELNEAGLNRTDNWDQEFDIPQEPGLWLWEGIIRGVHTHTPDCNEWDIDYIGSVRKLTPEEIIAVFNDDWEPPKEED